MKILVAIAHYYNPEKLGSHGSYSSNVKARINALSACLFNIHSLFGESQYMIDIFNKKAIEVNQSLKNTIDIVICTTENNHLLEHLAIPNDFYSNRNLQLENPKFLGFECQKVLKENLGKYDYYCFMEDDLIIQDPLFFQKLNWFNNGTDFYNLLLPNRYEASSRGKVLKAYVDGDINPRATEKFQNINELSHLHCKFLNRNTVFQRSLNPHSGCYFLNQKQMKYWVNQPRF